MFSHRDKSPSNTHSSPGVDTFFSLSLTGLYRSFQTALHGTTAEQNQKISPRDAAHLCKESCRITQHPNPSTSACGLYLASCVGPIVGLVYGMAYAGNTNLQGGGPEIQLFFIKAAALGSSLNLLMAHLMNRALKEAPTYRVESTKDDIQNVLQRRLQTSHKPLATLLPMNQDRTASDLAESVFHQSRNYAAKMQALERSTLLVCAIASSVVCTSSWMMEYFGASVSDIPSAEAILASFLITTFCFFRQKARSFATRPASTTFDYPA